MAEQQLLGMASVGGNEEVLRIMQSLSESVEKLAAYMEKAGESAHTTGDYVKEMNTQQIQMNTQIITYNQMITNVQQNTLNIKDNNIAILNAQRDINIELDSQQQKTQGLAEEHKKLEDGKRRNIEKTAKSAAEAIKDPAKMIQEFAEDPMKMIKGLLPGPVGAAIAVGAAALSKYREFEDVSRAGGVGVGEAFGGVGNMMSMSMEARLSSLIGLASMRESMAAQGTLVGKAGFRGDELKEAFDGLAQSARNAGIKLSDYAAIMANIARTAPEMAVSDIKALMEKTSETAASKKILTKDLQTAMSEVFHTMRPYGASGGEMEKLLPSLSDAVKMGYEGILKSPEIAPFFSQGAKRGLDLETVTKEFISTLTTTRTATVAFSDIENLREQIINKALPYSKDFATATANSEKAAESLVEAVNHGKLSMATLLAIFDDAASKFGKTPEQIGKTAGSLDTFGKSIHMSGATLGTAAMSVSGELLKLGFDSNVAFGAGLSAVTAFGTELRDKKIDVGDMVKVMKTQFDVFGVDTIGETKDHMTAFMNVIKHTNIRMEEYSKFLGENSGVMRSYGIDQAEGSALFFSMNQYLRDTTMSVQTFNDMLKGPAAAPEGVQAMAYSRIAGMGGALGEAARNAGGPAGFTQMYEDIQTAAENGKISAALEKAFGGGHGATYYKALNKTMGEAVEGSIRDILGGAGATDIQSFMGEFMFKKLAQSVAGVSMAGTRGGAVGETMKTISQGGTLHLTQKQMADAAHAFGVHTDVFKGAVGTFERVIAALAAAAHIPAMPPATSSGRKSQTMGPSPATFDSIVNAIRQGGGMEDMGLAKAEKPVVNNYRTLDWGGVGEFKPEAPASAVDLFSGK
jgi:hypothetical protein